MTERRDEFEALAPSGAGDAARAIRGGEHVLDGEIEWRPRGVGALLDLGFDLLRSRFASCLLLAVLIWLPWRYLIVAITPSVQNMQLDPDRILVSLVAAWTVNILVWVAQSIVTAFVARLLFDAASGRDAGVGSTLLLVVRRLPGLFVLGLISFLLLIASFFACILPIVGMTWVIAPMMTAYVIEDIGIGQAVKRSFRLSFENLFSFESFYTFWRWAGVVVVSSIFLLPLSGLVGAVDLPGAREWIFENWNWSEGTLSLVSILVGSILLGAATAIQASVLTAYYLDQRVRRDGLDLGVWFGKLRALNARANDRSAAP